MTETQTETIKAFTPTVRAIQTRKGSRQAYARMEARGGWRKEVDADLEAVLAATRSLVFATASADGQPYVQHRGGPAGFVRVIDDKTIAFADYSGNRQYISLGNLAENPKAHILIVDYLNRRRVKLWGTARVVEDDPELLARLMPEGYDAAPEQAIVFTITEWDRNCPQHIPRMVPIEEATSVVATLKAEITRLEAALAAAGRDSAP